MAKSIIERIGNFSDVCTLTKKEERLFKIPVKGTAMDVFIARTRRVWLIAKAYNGKVKIKQEDTSQWKHTPLFEIIPDKKEPSGFRLSLDDYDYDRSRARPSVPALRSHSKSTQWTQGKSFWRSLLHGSAP